MINFNWTWNVWLHITHQYDVTTFEICIQFDVHLGLREQGGGTADDCVGTGSSLPDDDTLSVEHGLAAGSVNVEDVIGAVCLNCVKQDDPRGLAGLELLKKR